MKLTGLGKALILIIVAGIAIGGWRAWNSRTGSGTGSALKLPKLPGLGDGSHTTTAGNDEPVGDSEVLLVTSASKKGWLIDEIDKFNAQNNGTRIKTKFLETREAMHAILEGKVQPALWCPSSVIWTGRLEEAWREKQSNAILTTSDPSMYRVVFRTPLVFLTTKQKAAFLRPLLRSPRCWDHIAELGSGQRKTPWGRFKWSHADPLNANSGIMTLGLILADYADQTGQSGDLEELANGSSFRARMLSVESGLVYDLPAQGGSSALTKAFVKDTSRYDAITAYENSALEAAVQNPNLAVIYPNPTAISENVVALTDSGWLSDKQREGAKAFIKFLSSEQSLRDGLSYYLRPAQGSGNLSLASQLSAHKSQGFQQSFSLVELPPYTALNSAAFSWRVHKARK